MGPAAGSAAASRDRVLDAVITIVARRGLDAVSVRNVAAEAGVSGGAVQHHFPTKHSMLGEAMDAVVDRVRARIARVPTGTAPAALRGIAAQLVPLDPQRAAEGRVCLAFLARAAVDPELAAHHQNRWQQLEDVFSALFAASRGRASPTPADRTAAGLLLGLLDGLAIAGLIETDRLPARRIRALIAAQLDLLLDPRLMGSALEP